MPPHTTPEPLSGQSALRPAEQVHRAIVAMRSAAEYFTDAAIRTPDKSHTDLLMRLVANVEAAIPHLLRIERDLKQISRRPA